MEERVGRGRDLGSLDCPSPRSSPHSSVARAGTKFAQAVKTFMDSSIQSSGAATEGPELTTDFTDNTDLTKGNEAQTES